MSVNAELRTLDIDIPTQPDALVRLSLLLAHDDIDLPAVAQLIESDMALAAAVLKAVQSSLYAIRGRVQSVQQAITYLGLRDVAAITYEFGLRAAFPASAELQPMWDRAARRGFAMGRLAQGLGADAWAAHSAGLFQECGKAVLFRHARDEYRAMLREAPDDTVLAEQERERFGVSHDALGAAMCESWGLSATAVASVRHHRAAWDRQAWPGTPDRRGVLAVSVIAEALIADGALLEERLAAAAAAGGWPEALLREQAVRVRAQLAAAETD